MGWKIISEDSQGAQPIHSVEDGSLIGLEGWRVLNSKDAFLRSTRNFVDTSSGIWDAARVYSSCPWHYKCGPNQCIHRNCEHDVCYNYHYDESDGDLDKCSSLFNYGKTAKDSCHKPDAMNPNCFCGIHSFPTLSSLQNSIYWQGLMKAINRISNPEPEFDFIYPVRLAHAGKLLKGSMGVRSHVATLTGILMPEDYTGEPQQDLIEKQIKK